MRLLCKIRSENEVHGTVFVWFGLQRLVKSKQMDLLFKIQCYFTLQLGENRNLYIDALKEGDEEDYTAMIKKFADIINVQLSGRLSNILKMYATGKKVGQVSLSEYFE